MAHTKVPLHHFSVTDGTGDRKLNQCAQKHFSQLLLPGIIFSSKNEELKLRISHLMISVRKVSTHNVVVHSSPPDKRLHASARGVKQES